MMKGFFCEGYCFNKTKKIKPAFLIIVLSSTSFRHIIQLIAKHLLTYFPCMETFTIRSRRK